MKRIIAGTIAALAVLSFAGCASDADKVSTNLSKDAEQFRIIRRIVVINGITDKVLLEATGRCSIENDGPASSLAITCKDETGYKKHFVGLSDNTTFVSTQLEGVNVSAFRTKFIIKPENIIPDFDLVTSGG
jgi:hypothetical protein